MGNRWESRQHVRVAHGGSSSKWATDGGKRWEAGSNNNRSEQLPVGAATGVQQMGVTATGGSSSRWQQQQVGNKWVGKRLEQEVGAVCGKLWQKTCAFCPMKTSFYCPCTSAGGHPGITLCKSANGRDCFKKHCLGEASENKKFKAQIERWQSQRDERSGRGRRREGRGLHRGADWLVPLSNSLL